MKPESVYLRYVGGGSDKDYRINLQASLTTGWTVDFSYGRHGSTQNEGTKTNSPVSYEQAKRIYDKLLNEKLGKGYTIVSTSSVTPSIKKTNLNTSTGVLPQLLNPITEDMIETYLKDDNWCIQEKYDGERRLLFARLDNDTCYAANRKGLTIQISKTLFNELNQIGNDCILDSEDLGHTVYVFDVISPEYADLPYKERYDYLGELLMNLSATSIIKKAETAFTEKDKRIFLKNMKAVNAEGVVFKDIRAPYTPGRPASGGTQVKFKFCETASCIVTKINPTKRSVELAVLSSGIQVPVGNATVYPNLKMPEIADVVEVKYLYAYPGGSLYQPVLLGIRNDIDRDDCLYSKLKMKRDEH